MGSGKRERAIEIMVLAFRKRIKMRCKRKRGFQIVQTCSSARSSRVGSRREQGCARPLETESGGIETITEILRRSISSVLV
jgi:hypothetical protein